MSRVSRTFAVYGFASTHGALAAEAALKAAGVAAVPVPSPRELSELCGIALRVELADVERVEDVLSGAGLEWRARAEMEDF